MFQKLSNGTFIILYYVLSYFHVGTYLLKYIW